MYPVFPVILPWRKDKRKNKCKFVSKYLYMLYSLHILDYLDPVNTREISNDDEYKDGQVGKLIEVYEEEFPDLLQADLILIGCREERGARRARNLLSGPDLIRRQFYQLYHWHSDIRIADVGNIKPGSTL